MSTISQQHTTTGTQRRPAHVLSGKGLTFALEDEARQLSSELAATSGGRAAKTLAKAAGLRATLVLLEAGRTLTPESAAGGASLQVLSGRLRITIDGESIQAGPGNLVILSDNLREPIAADEESLFLLTVAWPEGAGAWNQEAAAGRL
jgi:quercetin dioxygenase-like cupin family protein